MLFKSILKDTQYWVNFVHVVIFDKDQFPPEAFQRYKCDLISELLILKQQLINSKVRKKNFPKKQKALKDLEEALLALEKA